MPKTIAGVMEKSSNELTLTPEMIADAWWKVVHRELRKRPADAIEAESEQMMAEIEEAEGKIPCPKPSPA